MLNGVEVLEVDGHAADAVLHVLQQKEFHIYVFLNGFLRNMDL